MMPIWGHRFRYAARLRGCPAGSRFQQRGERAGHLDLLERRIRGVSSRPCTSAIVPTARQRECECSSSPLAKLSSQHASLLHNWPKKPNALVVKFCNPLSDEASRRVELCEISPLKVAIVSRHLWLSDMVGFPAVGSPGVPPEIGR